MEISNDLIENVSNWDLNSENHSYVFIVSCEETIMHESFFSQMYSLKLLYSYIFCVITIRRKPVILTF